MSLESILTPILTVFLYIFSYVLKYICWAFDIVKKGPADLKRAKDILLEEIAELEKEETIRKKDHAVAENEPKKVLEEMEVIPPEKEQNEKPSTQKSQKSNDSSSDSMDGYDEVEDVTKITVEKERRHQSDVEYRHETKKAHYVKETIKSIKETCRTSHNTTEYDAAITEDIHDFIQDPDFFTIELSIITRIFKSTKFQFTSSECSTIITETLQNYGESGMEVVEILRTTQVQCKETIEEIVHHYQEHHSSFSQEKTEKTQDNGSEVIEEKTSMTVEKESNHQSDIEYLHKKREQTTQKKDLTPNEEIKTEKSEEKEAQETQEKEEKPSEETKKEKSEENVSEEVKEEKKEQNESSGFSTEQWVEDTISTVRDVCKHSHNTTDYDERIIEDIHEFVKNPKFFTLELPIICRTIKNSNQQFSTTECKQIISETLKNYGDKGMEVVYILQTTQLNSEELLDVISVINSPITNAIVNHPFMPSTVEEDTSALEKEISENTQAAQQIKQTVIKYSQETLELQRKKEELTTYKQKGENWSEVKQTIEQEIVKYKAHNVELTESIHVYKPAAMESMEVPDNFVDDIIEACKQNNIESVLYLLQKDKSLANLEVTKDSETWTPLMVAAKEGNFEIVQILTTYGANVNVHEWHGSVLSYAEESHSEQVVQFLKSHGAKEDDDE